jgi:ADP-ribose pyrophosphatase
MEHIKCLTPNEKWMKLYNVGYKTKSGKDASWTFASRKKTPEIMDSTIHPDAVIIAANYNDKLVITKEFRIPLGDYEYGFPAGLVKEGEDIKEAIRRELKEETGLDVKFFGRITPPLYSSAGMTDESTVFAFVDAEGTVSTKHQEDTENIEVILLDVQGIEDLLSFEGQFKDKKISCKLWPLAIIWHNMMEE